MQFNEVIKPSDQLKITIIDLRKQKDNTEENEQHGIDEQKPESD